MPKFDDCKLLLINLYRRHGSIIIELKLKTPFNAIEKPVKSKAEPWFEIKPEIFKENTLQFNKKILNLKIINNTSCQRKLYET